MKKMRFFVSTLVGVLTISLIGCSAKLPTTPYEKVKFAFNGVEKSLKSPKASKKSLLKLKRNKIGGNNTESGLNTIFSLYTDEDKRDDFLDDISYNEPPMVQFQYVKKVLEKVGSGYGFNKKYYDTVTGDMYLDINTGLKKEGDEYKYNYTFLLGMNINIDDNNFITCDVSFDINLKKGNESYTTKWYVGIELDYDMVNSSPNYTMSMVTESDERELPFYNRYTYEYDYVDVKNSSINEWRKFCMDNDHRLIKDDIHADFNSYINEGCKYKIDACAWFKDGIYYKNKQVRQTGEKAVIVANALFKDLGLNSNEINADAFFNKTCEANNKIKECYSDFSKIAKEDIIYNLVCKDDNGEEDKHPSGIRAMNADLSGGAGNYSVPSNVTIRQLLTSFKDNYGDTVNIHLYYIDQNQSLLSEITDLVALRYFVRQQDNDEAIEVSLTDTLYDIMVRGKFTSRWLYIAFMDNQNIGGLMEFVYAGDLPDTYVKPMFPKVLLDLGIPEYDGERIMFGNQEYNHEPYVLEITNTKYDEAQAYKTKLTNSGFAADYEYYGSYKGRYFRKEVNNKYLYVNYDDSDAYSGVVTIRVFHEDKPEPPVEDEVNSITMVGDFNDWNVTSGGMVMMKGGDKTFYLNQVRVEAHQAFKFVVNNKWGVRGGFGYSDFINLPNYAQFLTGGENNNVVVLDQALVLTIEATVESSNDIFFNIIKLEVQQPK